MLDIGGWEFLMVAFVLVMVVGPKELPKMLRGFTRFTRQMRQMAAEFTRGLEDIAAQSDVNELKDTVTNIKQGDYTNLVDVIDPTGDLAESVGDVKRSITNDVGLEEIKSMAHDTNTMIAGDAKPHRTKKPVAKKPKKSTS